MADEPAISSPLALEEYRAMRATIRERGSLRFLIAAITFSAWAGATLLLMSLFVVPALSLISLLVLAAGFEVVFAIHVGVERIGRYLQVQYERPAQSAARWEHTAMNLDVPSGGVHALFLRLFQTALLLNWLLAFWMAADPAEPTPWQSAELMVVTAGHLGVMIRWVMASRFASSQRARELEALTRLLAK